MHFSAFDFVLGSVWLVGTSAASTFAAIKNSNARLGPPKS